MLALSRARRTVAELRPPGPSQDFPSDEEGKLDEEVFQARPSHPVDALRGRCPGWTRWAEQGAGSTPGRQVRGQSRHRGRWVERKPWVEFSHGVPARVMHLSICRRSSIPGSKLDADARAGSDQENGRACWRWKALRTMSRLPRRPQAANLGRRHGGQR